MRQRPRKSPLRAASEGSRLPRARLMERVIVRESLSDSDANYVELYRRLGERDVTDLASLLAGSGSSQVLELGCAAGGTAIPLARRGLEVWAVDADASMLAMVAAAGLPNLRAVEARIEELELGPRFDLVLASSHLVNVVDDAARAAYFRARPPGTWRPAASRSSRSCERAGSCPARSSREMTCDWSATA